MVRAALFDFGGVLTSSPFEAFAAYEEANGLPAGYLRRVNATNPDTNAWAQLERNAVGMDEFLERYVVESRALGHEVDGRAVVALLGGELRPAMIEAVRRCGEQLIVGCLTNNFVAGDRAAADPSSSMGEVLSLFDAVIESREVGVRKPDPRFYELACERLGIRPDEAVFLDDLGVNLKPARALGMTTIKVVDPEVAIGELEAVVGFPLR